MSGLPPPPPREPEVPVAWLTPGRSPRPEAERSLAAWASERGVRLAMPRASAPPALRVDLPVADAVEESLDRARDAISADDRASAEKALALAQEILNAHPELPQAAWLMAEVERGWAARWRRLAPRDPERAAGAWASASALDGGRAAGVGEESVSLARPRVAATLALDGPGEARLDGVALAPGAFDVAEGRHQLTVTVGASLVWASWVTVAAGTVLRADMPAPGACSLEDLSRARFAGGLVEAPGVRCGLWFAARPDENGLAIAQCEGAACTPPFRWAPVDELAPVAPDHHRSHVPGWVVWGLVGVAAVGVAVGAAAASGAFRPTHDIPMFTTGGVQVTSWGGGSLRDVQ